MLIHFLLTSVLKDLEWEKPKIDHFDLNLVYLNHCFTNITYINNEIITDASYRMYLNDFHKTHFNFIYEILNNELTSNLFSNNDIRNLILQKNRDRIGNAALTDISIFIEIFDSTINYNIHPKNMNENIKKQRLLNIIVYDINNCVLYISNTISTKESSKYCNKILNEFKKINLLRLIDENDKVMVYTKNIKIDGIYKKENNIINYQRVDLTDIKNYRN